jgi:predicted kinase
MDNKEQPSVVVMVGLPASGKSTARATAVASGASADSFQYSTDDIIDRIANDTETTYEAIFADCIKEATSEANEGVSAAIKLGRSVLWDQTNMSAKKRQKVLKLFTEDYRKECVCILPPFTAEQQIELERRVNSREGKSIPKFIMTNMLKSFMLPALDEGFSRVLYFDIYGNMIETEQAEKLFPQPQL